MLSVIVCTYNRVDQLRVALDSLLSQKGIGDYSQVELLLVDNNSTDLTRQAVLETRQAAPFDIRYIFEARQGKSVALNTGIANAKGDLLAFTDDDVVADEQWIASIFEAERKYPHLVFGGKVLPLWPDSVPDWIDTKGRYLYD